ncbi:MAG: hypothetical protein GY711_29010 [bacterium]|nr:hypothetical protein [bacterium]
MKSLWRFAAPCAALLLAGASAQEPATAPAQEKEVRYANPGLLVDSAWLHAHGQDAGVRIVDARSADAYADSHIPGAVSIPRSSTFAADAPSGMVAGPERIAELFGKQGIDAKTHVIVYDEGVSHAAARIFWTLELYGHPHVSVLDGGIGKWVAEERNLTKKTPEVRPARFEVRAKSARSSSKKGLIAGVGKKIFLDVRSDREWSGGRIPGAVHVEWTKNFTTGEVPVYQSPAELAALYSTFARDKAVHAY